MVVAMAARVPALIGFSVLLGVFSVAEKRWSLHPQRVFRTGWATEAPGHGSWRNRYDAQIASGTARATSSDTVPS